MDRIEIPFPEADINEFEAVDVDEKVAEAAIKAVGAKDFAPDYNPEQIYSALYEEKEN